MNNSAAIELTGKVTVVALVILFLVVLFLLFLHFYAKWFYYRREEESLPTTTTTTTTRRVRRRRHSDVTAGETELCRGLNPSVLKSIPAVIFEPKDFKTGIDCAVCLSDLVAGEEARILPECNHGFHVDCIDMWFQSHSTCPICRNPVSVSTQLPESTTIETTEDSITGGPQRFPTNVLFYGDQTEINSLGTEEDDHRGNCIRSEQTDCSSSSSSFDRETVIDVPDEDSENARSLVTTTTKPRSLKRLLSRDRRVNPPNNSFDTEIFDQIHE